MLICHTIYAYVYEKEMKDYRNDYEFQLVYQGFENIVWFI